MLVTLKSQMFTLYWNILLYTITYPVSVDTSSFHGDRFPAQSHWIVRHRSHFRTFWFYNWGILTGVRLFHRAGRSRSLVITRAYCEFPQLIVTRIRQIKHVYSRVSDFLISPFRNPSIHSSVLYDVIKTLGVPFVFWHRLMVRNGSKIHVYWDWPAEWETADQTDCLTDWSTDWVTSRLGHQPSDWLTDWLIS